MGGNGNGGAGTMGWKCDWLEMRMIPWERDGMGTTRVIPAHLYARRDATSDVNTNIFWGSDRGAEGAEGGGVHWGGVWGGGTAPSPEIFF